MTPLAQPWSDGTGHESSKLLDNASLPTTDQSSVEAVLIDTAIVAPADTGEQLADAVGALILADNSVEADRGCNPRIVVEAMVTRHLNTDEAFLDFTRV